MLVACLRRIQSWTLTSILSEFRLQSGPRRFFDIEQFIERFDVSKFDSLMHTEDYDDDLPEFLVMHKSLLEEEKRLIHSLNIDEENPSNAEDNTIKVEEEIDSFQVMNQLFFSDKQTVLSAGLVYDPLLR